MTSLCRTLGDYVDLEIISPIVSLVNELRRNPSVLHSVTEVRFFAEFRGDSIKFPIFLCFPHLSFQQDIESGEFSLPMSTSLVLSEVTLSRCATSLLVTSVKPCQQTISTWTRMIFCPFQGRLTTQTSLSPLTMRSCRHSDFDRDTLVNSRAAVEQFFRWKASKRAEHIPGLVGTAVHVESLGLMERHLSFQPRYPLEPLPESTRAHLIATARPSFPQFVSLLNGSRSFSLLLDEELTPSKGTGYARTFSCRLTAVDGQLPSDDVPKNLSVKLFDGRAASVPAPTEYLSLAWWSRDFYTAEDMLQNEINAYTRLEHARGTVVPYFYRAHRVKELLYPLLTVPSVLLVHISGWTAPGRYSHGVCDEVREETGPTYRCRSNRIWL
ncbi:hypothetical protein BS47DRAFT_442169 [Hydnum rufescens UP504]|uniref:Uncharacterized protein n=1 Tax=Hydnum rufescens UP504 TaxID=1448309 RepID=A0A9P6B4X9_9AGAM|nr:hypothetical protein BS47DRAFT_442169 [Hydnum rufescens UP504]